MSLNLTVPGSPVGQNITGASVAQGGRVSASQDDNVSSSICNHSGHSSMCGRILCSVVVTSSDLGLCELDLLTAILKEAAMTSCRLL